MFQSIMNAAGPTLAGIIICLAIVAATYTYQSLLQRLPANVRDQVERLAGMVVPAIEQQFADSVTTTGRQKKQAAMDMINAICQSLHIPLDITHASAAIEAAVYALNQAQSKVAEQPTAVQPRVDVTLRGPTDTKLN
jgi:hypothetical protein